MSAELLRQAATILRERATAATPGPWWIDGLTVRGDQSGRAVASSMFGYAPDAQWFATMHPGVGLALADWLDDEAMMVESRQRVTNSAAVELARLIVGGDTR